MAAVFLIFGFGGQQKNSLFKDIQDSLALYATNEPLLCLLLCRASSFLTNHNLTDFGISQTKWKNIVMFGNGADGGFCVS